MKMSLPSQSKTTCNPFIIFKNWYDEAFKISLKYPNAMTLSTASKNGIPSSRVVLLKYFNEKGFYFFTNYQSRKGLEISKNPHVALNFYWPDLNKQVRIEGQVIVIHAQESDDYWSTRSKKSQLNSLASDQSEILLSKQILIQKIKKLEKKFEKTSSIPRPKNWGGYCLVPKKIEFWTEGKYRLHDRVLFQKKNSIWMKSFLSP